MLTLLEQSFPAETGVLAAVRAVVGDSVRAAGCSEESVGHWVLAVNEACMNIIQHGYGRAAGRQFRLRIVQDDSILHVQLLDNGRVATLADLQPRALDDLRPGGLGVRFMREVTDNVRYLTPPDGFTNLLQLSKRIE